MVKIGRQMLDEPNCSLSLRSQLRLIEKLRN